MNCKPITMDIIKIPCIIEKIIPGELGSNTDRIISTVALHSSLTERIIKSHEKGRKLTDARKMVTYLLRKYEPGLTQTYIGELLKVHRTTIVYYSERFSDLVMFDPHFKATYAKIKSSLYDMSPSKKYEVSAA